MLSRLDQRTNSIWNAVPYLTAKNLKVGAAPLFTHFGRHVFLFIHLHCPFFRSTWASNQRRGFETLQLYEQRRPQGLLWIETGRFCFIAFSFASSHVHSFLTYCPGISCTHEKTRGGHNRRRLKVPKKSFWSSALLVLRKCFAGIYYRSSAFVNCDLHTCKNDRVLL